MNRRDFVPARVWHYPAKGRPLEPLDREDDPERWEALVAADDAVITHVSVDRDGLPWPASSSSAPSVMRRMIDALALEPGMSVLEIGAGTGYNAALLAEAGARVTTVDIDADVAEGARSALKRTGFADRVTVVTGDGEHGAPEQAPFDRVIATAGVQTIPYAWVEQTRDGGRIVVPYNGTEYAGALLTLDVKDGSASGGATADRTFFMPLRSQKNIRKALRAGPAGPLDRLRVTITHQGQTVTFEP